VALPVEIKADLRDGEAPRVRTPIEETQAKCLHERAHVGMRGVNEFPPEVDHEAGTDPVPA
jgi:hypothetical protein